jgi:hypothetical protein
VGVTLVNTRLICVLAVVSSACDDRCRSRYHLGADRAARRAPVSVTGCGDRSRTLADGRAAISAWPTVMMTRMGGKLGLRGR